MRFDVAILGAGPAAWAIAAAFGPTQRTTAVIAPDPTRVWGNSYGGWLDQLDESVASVLGCAVEEIAVVLAHQWPNTLVIGERTASTGRTYVRFDNTALLRMLMGRAAPAEVFDATVGSLQHGDRFTTAHLHDGRSVDATVVIDATGAASPFVVRTHVPADPAIQSAYGIVTTLQHEGFRPGSAILMDWRGPDHRDATFLYALPLGDDRWLLEETSLARRTALPMAQLEQRLHERLARMNVTIGGIESTELVSFPVEGGVPDLKQRVVGFGAAGGLTHPATGYSVVRSLRAATAVAAAVHASLDDGPHPAARAGWQAMWSDDRCRAHRLEHYGLTRLLHMNQRETREFFDTFFTLPTQLASAYLSGEASSREIAGAMWTLFRRSSRRTQAKLAAGNPLTLARSLLR